MLDLTTGLAKQGLLDGVGFEARAFIMTATLYLMH